MKTNLIKMLIMVVTCLNCGQVQAQQLDTTWAPPGAQWFYTISVLGQWNGVKMVYDRDTVIDNRSVKVMEISQFINYNPTAFTPFAGYRTTAYMYEENGTVYHLIDDSFKPLYVFSAQVGDKWEVNAHPEGIVCSENSMNVDSLIVTNITYETVSVSNGNPLPIIEVASMNGRLGLGRIIKGIGGLNGIFPYVNASMCHNYGYSTSWGDLWTNLANLNCYQDSVRGTAVGQCQEWLLLDTKSKTEPLRTSLTSLNVYPNPAIDGFYFDFPSSGTWDLMVFDMAGRCITSCPNIVQNFVDVSALNSGFYVVHLRNENGRVHIGKLIKN